MSLLKPQEVVLFQTFIRRWYVAHGRHELPWRHTTDPYLILVSEIMLQQTQVERVIPKFLAFAQTFPTVKALATAPLAQVLKLWQGLGYNRRAKYLHQAACAVVVEHAGAFPRSVTELVRLPGIGPYTSAALSNFAYNQAAPLIETNVRTVYLHHFFPARSEVPDSEVLAVVAQTLDAPHPREWFWALMDYGAYLKAVLGNQNQRSKQYAKQTRFAGSLRQVRGEIIRLLSQQSPQTQQALSSALKGNPVHFPEALKQLLSEQLVIHSENVYQLP